jgi:hypothetical protein
MKPWGWSWREAAWRGYSNNTKSTAKEKQPSKEKRSIPWSQSVLSMQLDDKSWSNPDLGQCNLKHPTKEQLSVKHETQAEKHS